MLRKREVSLRSWVSESIVSYAQDTLDPVATLFQWWTEEEMLARIAEIRQQSELSDEDVEHLSNLKQAVKIDRFESGL